MAAASRLFTATYVTVGLVACLTMIVPLAFPGADAHEAVRHVEFQGIAIDLPSITGPASNFRLSGDPMGSNDPVRAAFRWWALTSGSTIDLRATEVENSQPKTFRAVANGTSQVIRLNGICVNLPLGASVPDGSGAKFTVTAGDHPQTSITFGIEVSGTTFSLDGGSGKVALRDRMSLRDAFLEGKAPAPLAALSAAVDESGASICDELWVVRSDRADPDSPVELVGNPARFRVARADGHLPDKSFTVSADAEGLRLDAESEGGTERIKISETRGEGRTQIVCSFDPPRAYPLPPPELLKADRRICLASGAVGQQANGYVFDTGNPNDLSLENVTVLPDGRFQGRGGILPLNQPTQLGATGVSPIFAVVDPIERSRAAWLVPLTSLFLGGSICLYSVRRRRRGTWQSASRSLAPLAPAYVLWVIVSCLLTVRYMLAYRVSTFPPFNMNSQMAESFRGCLMKASIGMLLIPPGLALLILVLSSAHPTGSKIPPKWRLKWADEVKRLGPAPWHTMAAVFTYLAFGLTIIGTLEALLHVKLVPASSLMEVALLVMSTVAQAISEGRLEQTSGEGPEGLADSRKEDRPRPISENPPPGRSFASAAVRPVTAFWIAMFLTVVGDPGSIILVFPLLVALSFRSALRSEVPTLSKLLNAVPALLCLAAIVAALTAPSLGKTAFAFSPAKSFIKHSAFPYRLLTVDPGTAQGFLIDPIATPDRLDTHELRRALLQRWQMRAYMEASGTGTFRAPLSNAGMTYPTMLSDAAFAVFLVGEHGRLAGAFAIALLAVLSLALFLKALERAKFETGRALAFGLFAIGGIFGFSGVYMSLADQWIIPFTGQNVPFLGLDSYRDLLLNGIFGILAVILIVYQGPDSDRPSWQPSRSQRSWRLAWIPLPSLVLAGWIWSSLALASLNGNPAEAFNLSQPVLGGMLRDANAALAESREHGVPVHHAGI
jgi:hypothetical protein